jgi:hypothetical protein
MMRWKHVSQNETWRWGEKNQRNAQGILGIEGVD